MALWEDHSSRPLGCPRSFSRDCAVLTAVRWGAERNDPPRAPFLALGGVWGGEPEASGTCGAYGIGSGRPRRSAPLSARRRPRTPDGSAVGLPTFRRASSRRLDRSLSRVRDHLKGTASTWSAGARREASRVQGRNRVTAGESLFWRESPRVVRGRSGGSMMVESDQNSGCRPRLGAFGYASPGQDSPIANAGASTDPGST